MSEPTFFEQLQQRFVDLKTRCSETDKLSWRDPQKNAALLLERREALALLGDVFAFCQGEQSESSEFLTLVYELAAIATRDSTGHSWKRDFPDNPTATKFYQALRGLVRSLLLRSERLRSSHKKDGTHPS